jgi:RNA polymerase-binding transcription factor DksA
MAKKSSSKKSSKKTAKTKTAAAKKKTTGKKVTAAAHKTPARKTVSKKTAVKKKTGTTSKTKSSISTKKLTKPKPTEKVKEKKVTMPGKKITKKAEAIKVPEKSLAERQAEERAKAMQKIKGYSKKDLEHFKQIILNKRDEIIEQLQNLKEQMLDPTTGEYINENSPYSLHMAEQGTDAMEREKTFLYAQRENKFLGYLEDALKRIEAGTYGICIECIEEPQHLCETCPLIPKARLEAVPHSQLCVPIKQRQEKNK